MLLALILLLLCLPLLPGGFPATRLRSRWWNCRVLGFVGYEVPIPPPTQQDRDLLTGYLAYQAGVTRPYQPRRVRVGDYRFITL